MATPGTDFRIDCESVVDAIHKGVAWATASQRYIARVFGMMHHAVNGIPVEDFVWMPAHTSLDQVGKRMIGNGTS